MSRSLLQKCLWAGETVQARCLEGRLALQQQSGGSLALRKPSRAET